MANEMAEIERAVAAGKLLESSATNIRRALANSTSPIVAQSVNELVQAGEWGELNDRFYKHPGFRDRRPARPNHRPDRDRGGARQA